MMRKLTYMNSLRSGASRFFIICCLLFIISAVPAAAQKRRAAATKTPAVPAIQQAREAFALYDFDKAESLLEKEITALKKRRKSAAAESLLLDSVRQGRAKLHATERIVIIDSIVCDKAQALREIELSRESGRIDSYASTYHTRDNSGATIYENEFANKRYLAVLSTVPEGSEASPTLRLAVSDKIGDHWSQPTPLKGLDNEDDEAEGTASYAQNFPFLLSDGITLYYGATGPESMGGYDIFVTRADGEDGSFLAPENMGYPYNSTANDYLLAIDEFTQLGWFITDRRQPEGKVCIYIFIPNDTRQLYGDETSAAELRALARLTSIRDTWVKGEKGETAQALGLKRLEALRDSHSAKGGNKTEFVFPIDDSRTYTRLTDFKSPVARQKMQQWVQLNKNSETDATMLSRLRDNYATAAAADRKQLGATILKLEATYYPQLEQLQQLAKDIRNAEITHK